MLVDTLGRMHLVQIDAEQAQWKLCRVEDKTTQKGGTFQVNLHDGRNILLPKNEYHSGTTLKVAVPQQQVLAAYPLEAGAAVLLIGGPPLSEIPHANRGGGAPNPPANPLDFRQGISTDRPTGFRLGP